MERDTTTLNHGKIEENGAKMDNLRFFRWIYLIEKRSFFDSQKTFFGFFYNTVVILLQGYPFEVYMPYRKRRLSTKNTIPNLTSKHERRRARQ